MTARLTRRTSYALRIHIIDIVGKSKQVILYHTHQRWGHTTKEHCIDDINLKYYKDMALQASEGKRSLPRKARSCGKFIIKNDYYKIF